jgi:glycosyltransferase involved in cell wall biosynthesis
MRVPRALIAHPSPDVYGSDRQLVESVAGLVDAGWDVTVVLPEPGPLTELLGDVRVEICDFPVLRKSLLRPSALARLALNSPRDLIRMIRLVRKVNPDVVYVNTVTIPIWILAARLAKRPVLVHVHEAEQDAAAPLRIALAAPMLAARSVIANSEASRQVVVGTLPRLARRTRVIYNGVAAPAPVEIEPCAGHLVLVGRLSPRKGIDVALEAVALLRREGRTVTIEICGTVFPGYEWYEAELRERAGRPDLEGVVSFAGYVNPTTTALAQASVVLVPSRVEPFGNTAVEAMLAGCPVIASNVQGLAEIVDDGRTGLLVTPGDASELAAAVRTMLDDPVLADRLSREGRSDAAARFSLARYRSDIASCMADAAHAGRH